VRVMLDTNVLISLGLFPSPAMQRLKEALGRDQVVLSDYVIGEARDVFRAKFPDRLQALDALLAELVYAREDTVSTWPGLPAVRDPEDMPVLASAVAAGVNALVTGDKDLTVLDLDQPLILTPAEYVALRREA